MVRPSPSPPPAPLLRPLAPCSALRALRAGLLRYAGRSPRRRRPCRAPSSGCPSCAARFAGPLSAARPAQRAFPPGLSGGCSGWSSPPRPRLVVVLASRGAPPSWPWLGGSFGFFSARLPPHGAGLGASAPAPCGGSAPAGAAGGKLPPFPRPRRGRGDSTAIVPIQATCPSPPEFRQIAKQTP